MKTTKIWRLTIAMLAAFSLASCSSDENIERRLSHEQRETYGQNISGEYPGEYVIVYKDKDSKEWTDEKGRHMEAHEETFSSVQLDVSDYKMQHVFFQDFPVSLISKVVDADKELSEALAEASPQAITARYDLGYNQDYRRINWAFTPNVMLLHLNYGGAEHHIRIEFNNNSQYYTFTEDELKQPKAFRSIAENGIALQLETIYDGPTLIQRFSSDTGNFMHIMFFIRKDVAEPAEKVVKSEADIEYEQQCPVEKYAIAKGGEYLVDNDGKVTYADGTPTPEEIIQATQ